VRALAFHLSETLARGLGTAASRPGGPPGFRLLGTVPHPNILNRHPQHPRERLPRIGPVSHQRLGPSAPLPSGDSRHNDPTPTYWTRWRGLAKAVMSAPAGRTPPRVKAVLTRDILFGMNILTLAGFVVMGLTLTLNRMGQAGKGLSIGLMTAGTALVFLGLYARG
jgi:hypothetical protein